MKESTPVTIKDTRRELGLTQKQMAALLGMSQSGVGRIEAGYEGRSETRQLQHHLAALLVLGDPEWLDRMTNRDLAALSPLLTQHINPYGRFELDMETRLALAS